MRVAYVLRYWPTLSETFVIREITALRALGVTVDVVALGTRADGAWNDEVPEVAVLRPERGVRVLLGLPHLRRSFLGPRDALRAAFLAREGARRGWEHLHVHFAGEAAEWAAALATTLGIPWSVTVHAVDLFRPRPSLPALLREAASVVTVSRFHVDLLRDRYGIDAVLLVSGLDAAQSPRASPRGSRPFVCVARDVPKKNLDGLVAALPPGVQLRLVSDAHRLGRPGILVGPAAPSRIGAILARGSAFVLPCRVAPDGDSDGLPVVLLEAMAAGLPVVTTAVAGIPEVVDDEVGWLLAPEDPAALADTLQRVAEDPTGRAERGAAARRRMEAWPTPLTQAEALLSAWRGGSPRSR